MYIQQSIELRAEIGQLPAPLTYFSLLGCSSCFHFFCKPFYNHNQHHLLHTLHPLLYTLESTLLTYLALYASTLSYTTLFCCTTYHVPRTSESTRYRVQNKHGTPSSFMFMFFHFLDSFSNHYRVFVPPISYYYNHFSQSCYASCSSYSHAPSPRLSAQTVSPHSNETTTLR